MTPPAGPTGPTPVAGLVLAAGGGRRLGGRPKALLTTATGEPLLSRAVRELREGGCDPVVVVLGAAPEAARLAGGAQVVVAGDWAEGMGASLRSGLEAVGPAPAVLVTLVDLPDVGAAVVRRVVEAWRADGARADALVRAGYAGRPGHPVLLGGAHLDPLRRSVRGDEGAQPYLRTRRVRQVECDDLASGRDVDRPADLDAWAVRAPEEAR